MDLSSCLELRSSPCVASSASLANGGGCGDNECRKDSNGDVDNEDDVERMPQRSAFNLVCVKSDTKKFYFHLKPAFIMT